MVQSLEDSSNATRELLREKQNEYQELLGLEKFENIQKALDVLRQRRDRVKLRGNLGSEEELDEATKRIFELMKKYEQDVKKIFVENGENITHITNVSPENMLENKIAKSIDRANNYETERGNWVFASSRPLNGKNPYIARSPQKGMVLIAKDTYVYGGDNIKVYKEETGRKRVVLREPNYAYKIDPKNFTPVVTLKLDKDGNPYFEFSEEWISEQEVDINDPQQVKGIEEIRDITSVIENYQVLCDVKISGVAMKIRQSNSQEQRIEILLNNIQSGSLKYINDEANININPLFVKAINKREEKNQGER